MSAATAVTVTVKNNPGVPIFPASDDEVRRRIDLLLADNAELDRRAALYRTSSEEFEALSMTKPLTIEQSYRHLGFLLGAFPPAAYFIKFGAYDVVHWQRSSLGILLLTVSINIVCILAGMGFGKTVGRQMEKYQRSPWIKMLVFSALFALLWALITGFAGGAVVFVIGGFVGPFLAAPVALAAFPAFAALLRLNERGLLIERKHLLPITYGISLAISAFILGFGKF
jgi:hypothetical protein